MQQSVRGFVRAALPWASSITKVDPGISGHGEGFMVSQFHTPAPGERLVSVYTNDIDVFIGSNTSDRFSGLF